MSSFTRTQIIAIGGNSWTPSRGGDERIYINNWFELIGLKVSRYNTGNISSATMDGEHISNTKAAKIIGDGKVYYHTGDGKIHAQGSAAGYIHEIVEGIGAELTAIEEEAAAEDAERSAAEETPADKVSALRAAGRTVRDIAAAIGVSASTIYRWARNICRPLPTNAANLAALTA